MRAYFGQPVTKLNMIVVLLLCCSLSNVGDKPENISEIAHNFTRGCIGQLMMISPNSCLVFFFLVARDCLDSFY